MHIYFEWRVQQEIMRPYFNPLDLSMGLLSTPEPTYRWEKHQLL
ncbi:MAG: hypothetical protein V7L23_20625 [Nostoc sp.]